MYEYPHHIDSPVFEVPPTWMICVAAVGAGLEMICVGELESGGEK